MTKLSDENVLLKAQVESVVQERENIKLEFQKLYNSIKATQVQHQQDVNELTENVNQKTYAYADVRAENQDLFKTISELKAKLKLTEKEKNVNTKFDKFATLEKLVCVTPLTKNKDLKAKIVSKRMFKAHDWKSETVENFIEKLMGMVCFGNDNFAAITGYRDYVQGSLTICHVYYVEGLRHNLFSVGQFCDGDLETWQDESIEIYLWQIDTFGPWTCDFGIYLENDFDQWARMIPGLGFLINLSFN
nr:integrase, catalytic region, zinc finger, CCHC-type, peptidase aspartic, catalytic [Tanacetum cinerariifolium]